MREGLSLRRVRRALITGALCAAATATAGLPSSALAAGSTVSVANATATPEQAVPVDLTVSGTNATSGSAWVEAVVRPAGGLACQSSYNEDLATLGSEDTTIAASGQDSVPAGAYSVALNFKPHTPGAYQVCTWLDGASDGSQPQAPPATVSLTARGPQVSELTVTVPKALTPNSAFTIAYTTHTDQPLSIYSVLTQATTCSSSDELQLQQNVPNSSLLGSGATVYGGPATMTATTKQNQGSYLLCTYIEGPNASEVDAAASTPITVGTPQTKLPPAPGLRITRATASHQHGITLTGTATKSFTGKLLVSAACGRSSRRGLTTVGHGRFSAKLALPAGCRSAKRVALTLTWGGSRAWSRQKITRSQTVGR